MTAGTFLTSNQGLSLNRARPSLLGIFISGLGQLPLIPSTAGQILFPPRYPEAERVYVFKELSFPQIHIELINQLFLQSLMNLVYLVLCQRPI